MAKEYVTDKIGEDYKSWKKGDKVLLSCGTGHGKTTFVLKTLAPYAESMNKSVLYLCNRLPLKKQVTKKVEELGLKKVNVMTYQKLQMLLREGDKLNNYSYIVADEVHYILLDSSFNDFTDLIFYSLADAKESVVICMSATPGIIFRQMARYVNRNQIGNNISFYYIPKDYSYVNTITLYEPETYIGSKNTEKQSDFERNDSPGTTVVAQTSSQETKPLEELFVDTTLLYIKDILENTDDKIVVFSTAGRISEIFYKEFGDIAEYYCSDNSDNKLLLKIRSNLKYNDELESYRFEKRILFTTIAIDNGIDLKDKKIRHIFTELQEMDSVIQCLGRKRSIDETDTCNFYIRNLTASQLETSIKKREKKLKEVSLLENNINGFLEKYGENKGRFLMRDNDLLYSYFTGENDTIKMEFKVNKIRKTYCYKILLEHKIIRKSGFFGFVLKELDMYDRKNECVAAEYSSKIINKIRSASEREDFENLKRKYKNSKRDRSKMATIIKNVEKYKSQIEDIKRLTETLEKYNTYRISKKQIDEIKDCMKPFGLGRANPSTINIFLDNVVDGFDIRVVNVNHHGKELRMKRNGVNLTVWYLSDLFINNDWFGFMHGDYSKLYDDYYIDVYYTVYPIQMLYDDMTEEDFEIRRRLKLRREENNNQQG